MRNMPYGTSYPCLIKIFLWMRTLLLTFSRAVAYLAETGAEIFAERRSTEKVTVSYLVLLHSELSYIPHIRVAVSNLKCGYGAKCCE